MNSLYLVLVGDLRFKQLRKFSWHFLLKECGTTGLSIEKVGVICVLFGAIGESRVSP
jgi:hypothetical protein